MSERVIVDIHPSDEFKKRLNSNDRQIEDFGKFYEFRTLSGKDKRPLVVIPATFVLSGSPHWTLFATSF